MPRQTKSSKLDDVKNTIPDTNVNTYDDVINDDIIENSFDNNNIESNNGYNITSNSDNDTSTNTTSNVDKQQEKEQDKQIESNNKEEHEDKIRLSDFDELINKIDNTETNNEKGDKEKTAERNLVKEEKVPKQRDYSIFSEEEQKLFKGTSNEVYEYLKNVLPKLKETESKYNELLNKQQQQSQPQQQPQQTQSKPTSFYDHPDAYLLSDEYRNTAMKYQMSNAEEQHWTEQLQRLRSGETKLTDFLGYDDKGNPKFSEIEIKPDMVSKAEVQLIKNIQAANYAKQNTLQELSKYTETHKKNYSDSISKIKEMENNFLSMYNEKSPRYKDIQTFINNIPPAFHNDPLLSPMSKMYAMILDLIDIAKKMKDNQTASGNTNDIKKKIQPSVSELKPGGNTDVIVYSPDEYKDEI